MLKNIRANSDAGESGTTEMEIESANCHYQNRDSLHYKIVQLHQVSEKHHHENDSP